MGKIQARVTSPIKTSLVINELHDSKHKYVLIKHEGLPFTEKVDDLQAFSTKEKLITFLDQYLSL